MLVSHLNYGCIVIPYIRSINLLTECDCVLNYTCSPFQLSSNPLAPKPAPTHTHTQRKTQTHTLTLTPLYAPAVTCIFYRQPFTPIPVLKPRGRSGQKSHRLCKHFLPICQELSRISGNFNHCSSCCFSGSFTTFECVSCNPT